MLTEQVNVAATVSMLIMFGTSGNTLYRLNNHLKIKPVYMRFLMGFMAAVTYIVGYLTSFKREPVFNFYELSACFLIGYVIEILSDVLEAQLPKVLNAVAKRYTGGGGNDTCK